MSESPFERSQAFYGIESSQTDAAIIAPASEQASTQDVVQASGGAQDATSAQNSQGANTPALSDERIPNPLKKEAQQVIHMLMQNAERLKRSGYDVDGKIKELEGIASQETTTPQEATQWSDILKTAEGVANEEEAKEINGCLTEGFVKAVEFAGIGRFPCCGAAESGFFNGLSPFGGHAHQPPLTAQHRQQPPDMIPGRALHT